MRKIILALTALLVVAAPVATLTAASATPPPPGPLPHSDARGCVSRVEYRALHKGTTQRRVRTMTGAPGVYGGYRRARYYKACGIDAWVVVEYNRHHRLVTRYRIGHD